MFETVFAGATRAAQTFAYRLLAPMIALTVMLAASAATAGTLTNVSATASSVAPGATGVTYTLNFTTETALSGAAGDHLFYASFPSQVVLPEFGFFSSETCDGNVFVSINGVAQNTATFLHPWPMICGTYSGNGLQLRLAATASVPAGSVVRITIPNVTNPTPFDTSPFQSFWTKDASSSPIDSASPLPSLTLEGPVAPVPTMTEWAMILMGLMLAGGAGAIIHRRRLAA